MEIQSTTRSPEPVRVPRRFFKRFTWKQWALLLIVGIVTAVLLRPLWQNPERGVSQLFPTDQTYHYESLRALGYATTGGADVNEILHAIGEIEAGDPESWYVGWSALADRKMAEADRYQHDQIGQGNALLSAANYYRTAEFMLYANDSRKLETYRQSIAAFYRGLDALHVPYERMEIPYAGNDLDGLYFPGDSAQHGDTLILMINGYDSIKEETYFTLGQEALARGFSFMSYDGPGQGSAIREHGIPFTPNWGDVNRAVVDAVTAVHPEIKEIILVGFSMGSILATKAAAADARISMLVQYNIMYDFSLTARESMPASFAERVFTDEPRPAWVSQMLGYSMRFSSEQDWAIRHGSWVMGIDDYAEVLNQYRFYEISQDAPEVTAPVLLLAGENDHFVNATLITTTEDSFKQAASITSITYDAQSGADEHCQVGAMNLWTADFFEWVYANLN
ncbi:MAG: alpha/beta fold hydrolase [Anaerolineales bacterium]|nr:alpha/beta fold hydrolase [Anaerolineales bacterium]